MGASDTTEKDWEEHYKEYLVSATEEYKIGYNKGVDDFSGILLSEMDNMNIQRTIMRVREQLKAESNEKV